MIYLDVLKSAVESRNVKSVSNGVGSTYSSMGRYMHTSHNICRSCLTQASAAKQIRVTVFWTITQGTVVIPYRRFGTNYRSHLQGSGIQDQVS